MMFVIAQLSWDEGLAHVSCISIYLIAPKTESATMYKWDCSWADES